MERINLTKSQTPSLTESRLPDIILVTKTYGSTGERTLLLLKSALTGSVPEQHNTVTHSTLGWVSLLPRSPRALFIPDRKDPNIFRMLTKRLWINTCVRFPSAVSQSLLLYDGSGCREQPECTFCRAAIVHVLNFYQTLTCKRTSPIQNTTLAS